jgi:hypothetical protein
LPNASSKGLAARMRRLISSDAEPATEDRYCRHFLVASVLPLPLSPLMMMACPTLCSSSALYDVQGMENRCGVLACVCVWGGGRARARAHNTELSTH